MRATGSLADYRAKRDFRKTAEPPPDAAAASGPRPVFVVQEHHASTVHYDFRLEHAGVLKSWAVPREPSMDPADRRLAVAVEDHPLPYAQFEGAIPAGQYGAGTVSVWDRGTFEPAADLGDGLNHGKIEFVLHGQKLRGAFALIRMKGRGGKNWLLIKGRDEHARPAAARHKAAKDPASRPRSPRTGQADVAVRHGPPDDVELTNGDRLWFPDDGITKGDVFEYYAAVAERLLPFLRDRPMTLERLPGGITPGEPHFWQKRTPNYYPTWIPRAAFPAERGRSVEYALVNDRPTLLYLVNQGTMTFHPWLSRVSEPDRPDFVLFDLDPGEASFADSVPVAWELRRLLDREGLVSVPKTSGKTGLHVLVPWTGTGGFDKAREWARSVAERAAAALPDLATVEIRKAKRGARVYIDTLQNAKGHHAVPPYVVRPVPGAPVSTPLRWAEVNAKLSPDRFTIRTALRRLSRQKGDPMAALLDSLRK